MNPIKSLAVYLLKKIAPEEVMTRKESLAALQNLQRQLNEERNTSRYYKEYYDMHQKVFRDIQRITNMFTYGGSCASKLTMDIEYKRPEWKRL